MALVISAQDPPAAPPIDTRLEELANVAAVMERPIRVRVQPDIYDHETKSYQAWTGLSWTIETNDIEEAKHLREGLTCFFRLFGAGAQVQEVLLQELQAAVVRVGQE